MLHNLCNIEYLYATYVAPSVFCQLPKKSPFRTEKFWSMYNIGQWSFVSLIQCIVLDFLSI